MQRLTQVLCFCTASSPPLPLPLAEYPLNVCKHQNNTIWQLLSTDRVVTPVSDLATVIAETKANGIPFFIGEGNSIACGGQAGVSDVMAAALWAVDALFAHAEAGVARWNFHGCPEGAYTAIAYANASDDAPDVRPLYYGAYAFTVAARGELYRATISSSNELVRAHVARTSDGTWTAVVVHKDPKAAAPARVTLRLPRDASRGAGSLTRLLAPRNDPFAKTGLTFAGQTWDGTRDGTPSGARVVEKVVAAADGSFSFDVPPASVAVLSFV